MKSLVIKTLIVISAVTLTGLFAFASSEEAACKDGNSSWAADVDCSNGADVRNNAAQGSGATPIGLNDCPECAAKYAAEVSLAAKTAAAQRTASAGSGSKGAGSGAGVDGER